jgi:hypothetical protein
MAGSTKNTFCIQYWKVSDPSNPKVLRRINKNGTPISTTYYDQVYFYSSVKEAISDCRLLMDNGYDIKIRKCNRLKENLFWLV